MRESIQIFPHSFHFTLRDRCQIANKTKKQRFMLFYLDFCRVCYFFFCSLFAPSLLCSFFFSYLFSVIFHWPLTLSSLRTFAEHTQSLDQNIHETSPVHLTLTQCHFNRTIFCIHSISFLFLLFSFYFSFVRLYCPFYLICFDRNSLYLH